MSITTIDPITALVVVDLQEGLRGVSAAHPVAEIVANAAALARAFRAKGLPVALINAVARSPGRVEAARPGFAALPPGWADLMPELGCQASDLLITKYTWGAFHGTPLDLQLRRRGVTQVVVCGIATSAGVESTARAAHEHGYHVTLAVDAMTDLTPLHHRHAVDHVFPRIGETGTAAEVAARLAG